MIRRIVASITLERVSSCCLIAASITLMWVALRRDAAAVPAAPGYQPGEAFTEFDKQTDLPKTPTLVMWVQTQCGYCTASMDFYKRLSATEGRTVRMVVLGHEAPAALTDYVAKHGFRPDTIVALAVDSPTRLSGTPTLVLLDNDRRILSIWNGQLPPDREAEVFAALK